MEPERRDAQGIDRSGESVNATLFAVRTLGGPVRQLV